MRSSRFLSFLLITFITFAEQFATASPPCTPERISDARVASRSLQMRFPDGRLITVVGHQHGARQVLTLGIYARQVQSWPSNKLENFVRDSLRSNSRHLTLGSVNPKDTARSFEQAWGLPLETFDSIELFQMADPGTVLDNAKNDESYVRSRLREAQDRPSFVGVETFGQTNINEFRRGYLFVKSQLVARKSQMSLTDQEIEDFLISGSMGQLHAYFSSPELAEIAPLLAAEGPEAQINGDKAAGIDAKATEKILAENKKYLTVLGVNQRKQAYLKLSEFVRAFVKVLSGDFNRFVDYDSGDAVATQLQESLPPWLKPAGKSLVDMIRAYANSVIERDRETAKNLADQKKSGLHFIGNEHLRSIIKHLGERCRAELSDQTSVNPGPIPSTTE